MRRVAQCAVVLLASAAAVAACGSARPVTPVPHPVAITHHTTRASTGVIAGTLEVWGGALVLRGHRAPRYAGTVRLIGRHGHIDIRVGRSGVFSARVPIGRYTVMAGLLRPMDWPMGSCIGLSGARARFDRRAHMSYVIVRAVQRLRVRVGCIAA